MAGFLHDTAVDPLGGGRYAADLSRRWWIARGPNGGYLAAIVLRAVQAEIDDVARSPRSLTLHYLRPPQEGPVEVTVQVLRVGRGMTTVAARMEQGGRSCIEALAALGVDRPGPAFDDLPMPAGLPGPEQLAPLPRGDQDIPIRDRYDTRLALGGSPFEVGEEALTGGWIRAVDDPPVDAALVAALTDAWLPAVFTRAAVPVGVPTIDLTIHFRQPPPQVPGWCLVRFRSNLAQGGYVEEDGEVWSADGRLLAQSRQLAVLLPPG